MVLDFKNQTYILYKSLPQTLPEGFLPRDRLTFKKFTQWHENNRKVHSIVLGSMSNEIQKRYERYEDVLSIINRMKRTLCGTRMGYKICRDEGILWHDSD
ncbi:UNVERIFIED_CONTAM: hypothetical protein Sradi_7192300 [Sesamum radiatum]|uniref:Uncharacterized protein n=1 Tax=Sesamum radiatum TaxID=300843 RepID=A0AAW2IQ90_SESRA